MNKVCWTILLIGTTQGWIQPFNQRSILTFTRRDEFSGVVRIGPNSRVSGTIYGSDGNEETGINVLEPEETRSTTFPSSSASKRQHVASSKPKILLDWEAPISPPISEMRFHATSHLAVICRALVDTINRKYRRRFPTVKAVTRNAAANAAAAAATFDDGIYDPESDNLLTTGNRMASPGTTTTAMATRSGTRKAIELKDIRKACLNGRRGWSTDPEAEAKRVYLRKETQKLLEKHDIRPETFFQVAAVDWEVMGGYSVGSALPATLESGEEEIWVVPEYTTILSSAALYNGITQFDGQQTPPQAQKPEALAEARWLNPLTSLKAQRRLVSCEVRDICASIIVDYIVWYCIVLYRIVSYCIVRVDR
jgi:hypothetical protein